MEGILTYVFRKQGGGRKDAAYLITVRRVEKSDDPSAVFYVVDKKWGKWSAYLQDGELQTQNAYSGTSSMSARMAVSTILAVRNSRGYERQPWCETTPAWSLGWPGVAHFKKKAQTVASSAAAVLASLPVYEEESGKLVSPTVVPESTASHAARDQTLTKPKPDAASRKRRRRGHRGRIEVD